MDIKESYPIVGDKFVLTDKLGSGSFGQIFAAISKSNNQKSYAVKFERKSGANPTLTREARVLTIMNHEAGFPRLHYFSKNSSHLIMVMTHLGPSLETVFLRCSLRFSLKTVLMVAKQLLMLIECFHNKQLIHRDIKPDNYVIGLKKSSSIIHMIDFGLAKYYVDSSGNHIPSRDGKGLIGTARYTSVNSHYGLEQSRRDDLESIGYILIYFMKRRLPWQDIQIKNRQEKFKKIHKMKMSSDLSGAFEDIPVHFAEYLKTVKSLGFTEKPDYAVLRRIFSTLFEQLGFTEDQEYDWCVSDEKRREIHKMEQVILRKKELLEFDSERIFKPKEIPVVNPFKIQIKQEKEETADKETKKLENRQNSPVSMRDHWVSDHRNESVSLLEVPKISSVINLIGADNVPVQQNNSLSTSRQANGSKLSSESDHGVEINFNLQTSSMMLNLEGASREFIYKEEKENEEEEAGKRVSSKKLAVNRSELKVNELGAHGSFNGKREEDFDESRMEEISQYELRVEAKLKHLVQSKKAHK